jgi:hypothetical protein
MKKLIIIIVVSICGRSIAFSQENPQKDSIWIAKYQSINGVTKYLGSTTLRQPSTNITDSKMKVIGTIDATGNLILTSPKKTLMTGRYAVYNTAGQLLYLVKID